MVGWGARVEGPGCGRPVGPGWRGQGVVGRGARVEGPGCGGLGGQGGGARVWWAGGPGWRGQGVVG